MLQLVECGARGEVLREENHALSRRVALLEEAQVHNSHLHHWKVQAEEATRNLMQAKKEASLLTSFTIKCKTGNSL